jgi:hypothetical protein
MEQKTEEKSKEPIVAKHTGVFKRALQNTLLITAVVGLTVHLQGESVAAGIMSMVYTFIFILPVLWLTYRYTDRVKNKRQ